MSKNDQDHRNNIGKLGMEQVRVGSTTSSHDTHHVDIRAAETDKSPVQIIPEHERRINLAHVELKTPNNQTFYTPNARKPRVDSRIH